MVIQKLNIIKTDSKTVNQRRKKINFYKEEKLKKKSIELEISN